MTIQPLGCLWLLSALRHRNNTISHQSHCLYVINEMEWKRRKCALNLGVSFTCIWGYLLFSFGCICIFISVYLVFSFGCILYFNLCIFYFHLGVFCIFIWCVSCTVVVLTCFVMCGCVYVWVFGNCVGVLVICVLVFAVFCIVCTAFLHCFAYVYLFLFVL